MKGRENKPHIGIFGRCNAGKSTLVNFVTGADVSIVSPESGTTTDPVRKSCEILGFAPVILIDTAGFDDASPLGTRRMERTVRALLEVDLAILVFREWGAPEDGFVEELERLAVPRILLYNGGCGPADGIEERFRPLSIDLLAAGERERCLLFEAIKKMLPENSYIVPSLFEGRVKEGDTVLLICPVDGEAPAGRLILPQVQAMRELLDRHAVGVVVQPQQTRDYFASGGRPVLAVTDSQVFPEVRACVPEDVELTSFSILLAAAKGDMDLYTKGLAAADTLEDGDRILISESCTHQVSCEDIGRVKIPAWLGEYSGKELEFSFVSGLEPLPRDIASYALVVQCGACMATRSQLHGRLRTASAAGVPVTNYGMLIRKIRQ